MSHRENLKEYYTTMTPNTFNLPLNGRIKVFIESLNFMTYMKCNTSLIKHKYFYIKYETANTIIDMYEYDIFENRVFIYDKIHNDDFEKNLDVIDKLFKVAVMKSNNYFVNSEELLTEVEEEIENDLMIWTSTS